MPTKKQNTADDEWEVAQAAFETARQLPAGAERFEALKKVGQLRYEADKKRNDRSGAAPGAPGRKRVRAGMRHQSAVRPVKQRQDGRKPPVRLGNRPFSRLLLHCGTRRGIAMIRIFEIVGAVVGAGLLILSVRLDDMRQRSKQRRSGEANGAHPSDREEITA
jgi:hypothetical protein